MKVFFNYSIDCELPPDGPFGGPATWDVAEASVRGFIDVMDCAVTVNMVGYYEGNPAHDVKIQVYDWIAQDWVNLTAAATDFPSRSTPDTYQFSIPSPCDDYLDSDEMRIRIIHTSNGSAGHDLYIDHLYLA